jgi:NDP-sugar pyrophosphorylase family protein
MTELLNIKWLDLDSVAVVGLDEPTRGQAETALLAMSHIDSDSPVLISNCDTFFTENFTTTSEASGAIGTFISSSKNYSYVSSKDGRVTRCAEKVVISNRATAGLYYFSSRKLYEEAYYGSNLSGEKFVAPLYNFLISQGKIIEEFSIDYVYPLGTSDEIRSAAKDDNLKAIIEKRLWLKENQE